VIAARLLPSFRHSFMQYSSAGARAQLAKPSGAHIAALLSSAADASRNMAATPRAALLTLCTAAVCCLTLAQQSVAQPVVNAAPSSTASGYVRTSTTVSATRAVQMPNIDGKSDDAVWKVAPVVSDFLQFQPHVDAKPTFHTEFQVAYDSRNLYVLVRMHDPHPDSIMHALSRRDVRGPSDQVTIFVDSYNDKRSGFEFAVNPDGVKRDLSISNDVEENDSWNGVWDVATNVNADGWSAEFRIPFSQLRYAGAAQHTFGLGVSRDIERLNEREAWPQYSPTRSGLASQLGQLVGLENITSARKVEAIPYIVTKNDQRILPANRFGRDQQFTAGADLKLGITPNITLDATINPDFGQVEADPATLNLTAFETFVREQRPFFVEGTGLYQFQLNCYIVVDCGTNEGLFYSRRIGRSPSLRDQFGDASTPSSTPISLATKLTGRTGGGLSFGLLDAVTPRVNGLSGQVVEPETNYAVLRAQQDLRGGEAGVSVIGTAVNRSLDALSSSFLHKDAFALGATFRNRFYKKEYEVSGQATVSEVQGSAAAIALTQTSSVHYYQQPGDDYVVDSTRTSLGGHAEQLKFGKYGGGITRFESSIVRQSAGFEVNDLGYLRRADFVNWSTFGALNFQTPRGVYNWARLNGNYWETWSTSGTRLENAASINGHIGFKNNWDVHLGSTFSGLTPTFCDRCTRGGPVLRNSSALSPWGGFNSDSRRTVSGGMWMNLGRSDEGRTTNTSFNPYVNVRMSTQLSVNFGAGVSHDDINAQWYGNFTDAGGVTHYTFAHLDQRTVSMNTKLNYTFTPNVTFEFYGEPFVAMGSYANTRELSATPDASSYDARFKPYAAPDGSQTTFKFTQLRTNAVARWEYRPGSTLFLVWAHGRNDSTNARPNQSWARDYRDLFALHPDNTFLIKVAYWLNR
jgi:hypothetical protein